MKKSYKRYQLNISIAVEALLSNKLRSLLSALGVVFGVAAVISMLSIGNGTELELLNKMKEVGVNNIIVSPFSISDQSKNNQSNNNNNDSKNEGNSIQNTPKKYSPGLTVFDITTMKAVMPNIKAISPYVEKVLFASCENRYSNVTVKAVSFDYFEMYNLHCKEGLLFNKKQEESGLSICVLSGNACLKLFGAKQAIGKKIKVGKLWFTVTGVLQEIYKKESNETAELSVYIPIQSYLLRIENNALMKMADNPLALETTPQNQLDKIIIQVKNSSELLESSKIVDRIILRKHLNVKDYEVTVPQLLLKQQEETKNIFNVVLGIIAGISLLVGGIGIMNIMNASVLERTREIGVRLAVGANKKDITLQFLAEAVLICLSGGIIGVFLGIIMSFLIMKITGITTVFSFGSILLSFIVTTSVGVFFGFYPAKKASLKDPIESLHYE